MNQIGRKFDAGKPEFSLLPPWALEAVAKVLTIGAKKYAVDNWKFVPNGAHRYKNAALRHLNSYMKGEQKDPETGENHLAHAICCLMFMLDSDESGVALADEKGHINVPVNFDVPVANSIFNHGDSLNLLAEEYGVEAIVAGRLPPNSSGSENTVSLSGTARPTSFLNKIFSQQ